MSIQDPGRSYDVAKFAENPEVRCCIDRDRRELRQLFRVARDLTVAQTFVSAAAPTGRNACAAGMTFNREHGFDTTV